MERSKLDAVLESIFEDQGPQGLVESLSFLFGAFAVTKNGIILGANQVFCDLLDYKLDELLDKSAITMVAEDQQDFLRNIFNSNSHQSYELALKSKNGELKYTRVSPKNFTVRGEVYRLAEFVDFTDTFHAQRELQESEERFKAIFKHAAIGFVRASIKGEWQELNQKICDLLGYTETELRQLSFAQVTHPDDHTLDAELINELRTGSKKTYRIEKRYLRKDGSILWGRLTVSLIRDKNDKPEYYVLFIEDIGEQKQLNDKLKTSDLIVSASSDMLAVLDEQCCYIAVNQAYAAAFNKTPSELVGISAGVVLEKEIFDTLVNIRKVQLQNGEEVKYNAWFNYPNGGRQYMNVAYSPILDETATFKGFAVSARNITDLKIAEIEMRELNEKLERYSFIDGLTRITNRRMFDEHLDNEWNRALRTDSPISFIMIDIDFFKNYNDHYGHLQGDECLVKIAQTLKTVGSRSSDIVARFGGEEFALLVPNANVKQACQLAERCRREIINLQIPHATTEVEGLSVVSVSIGVSSMTPTMKSSAFTLIDIADKRLYKAKHQGRNCIVYE
ncbi:MAG: diguanylate cyclase [Gammaproteobacteria bacterium]